MTKSRLMPLILLALAALASPVAARNLERIAITPQSPKALVILKTELLPTPPSYRTSYRIGVQGYDSAEQRLSGGPYGGNFTFAVRQSQLTDGYIALQVEPGTYAFRDLSRQDYWALCFNGGSLQFSVGPGEVLYLGEIDARMHVAELERLAVTSGRTSARSGQVVHFFDTVTPPSIGPVSEAELAEVAEFVRARMPRTTVAPRAAEFQPARFGTGRDLFGIQRICGGYYAGRARERGRNEAERPTEAEAGEPDSD